MLITGLIIGFVFGIVAVVIYASIQVKNMNLKEDKLIDNMKSEIDLVLSVKKRFTEITEITDRQMDLMSGAERPSASALHSKHQNGIISELKKLEEQKMTIFKSILQDGLDPNLSIMVDGKPTVMKMSEAVSMYETNQERSDNTESKIPRVKLRLITNEEANVSRQEGKESISKE